MTSSQKRKGTDWERQAVKLLEELIPNSTWKRIAGSGAIGTIMNVPELGSDIVGNIEAVGKGIRGEAKVGYGGATQITVKREWFEKVREEAEKVSGIPILVCKFSGSRGTVRYFMSMDFDAVHDLFEQVNKLYESEIKLLDELSELKKKYAELEAKIYSI